MLKKKLLFKEDKTHLYLKKNENYKILNDIESFEDAKKLRGRQLSIKTYNASQKNYMSKTKCKNKKFHNKSLIQLEQIKNKNKINISKFEKIRLLHPKSYLADSIEIEEEYESSDSDCSIRKNKKRLLLHESPELPDKFKYYYRNDSLNNSEEIIELCEQSDDLEFTYGENNLTNEVERILIDIYNNHVYVNPRSKLDITEYEKHRYKEKIFEISEIKQIKDRYYEIKANLLGKITSSQVTEYENNLTMKNKSNQTNGNFYSNEELFPIDPNLDTDCFLNDENGKKNIYCNYSTQCSKNVVHDNDLRFNESDRSVTKIILTELKKIKKLLIDSSRDIEKVFKQPLSYLKLNKQIVRFSIEDIHREEFNNTLLKDEFIEALIIQIKTIARELKIDDIHHLLSLIDDENSNKSSEMTRFTAFLFAQLNSSLDNEYEDEEISERSKSNSSQESVKNNIQTNTNSQVNSNSKYYTTNNTSLDLCDNSCFPSNKVSHEIGIDELVEFIQKPEIKKIKKNRKKKKNKKVEPEIEINDTFIVEDEEVENFKKLMNEDGRHVNSVKKIKPTISKAWLGYVSNKVYD